MQQVKKTTEEITLTFDIEQFKQMMAIDRSYDITQINVSSSFFICAVEECTHECHKPSPPEVIIKLRKEY